MPSSLRVSATIVAISLAVSAVPGAMAQDSGSAVPAQQRSGSAPTVQEEVIVRGQRMSEVEFDLPDYVRQYLGEIVALPPGGGHARWRYGVCAGVYNLEPTAAQYVVDRISRLAMEVGLKPGEPGCSPDVIIIFTVDADDLAANMVENQPRLFRPGGPVCCMQLGLDALDEFVASDKPVRWWHVSMPVDPLHGQRAIQLPQDGMNEYPVVAVEGPSRIHSGVIDALYHVVVIVDATQLTGTTWQEIGDYLAVISLAQINPKADPEEFDSILNLFSNPAAYSGLTDWDRTYVRALYEMNQERRKGLQNNELVGRIVTREEREFDD